MSVEPGSEHDLDNLVDAEGRLLPAYRYDYAGRCWWCGQTADSGEHKYKRTDLIRAFGAGPWKGESGVVQVVDEKSRDLQSPGAERLKFSKVLCGYCNSARSQPFDQAYEQFADYISHNQERILDVTGFRWSYLFGSEWKRGRNLVTAYWLKHIGCRFADGGIEVDPAIGRFLDSPGQIRPVPLRMELQIHEDWAGLGRHWRSHNKDLNSLWIGDLMCLYSISRQRIRQATCHWGLGWLGLTYQFDLDYSRANLNFWGDKVHLARLRKADIGQVIADCKWCREQ